MMKTGITSTLNTALSGLQKGIDHATSAAGEVAKLTSGSKEVQDIVKPLLALQQAEQEVAIASKVIKTESDTLGRFVDEVV